MIAEWRVETRTGLSNLGLKIVESEKNLKTQIGFVHSTVEAIETDLTEVQRALRELKLDHDQAILGLTELGKTTFDMSATILKRLRGDEEKISHDADSEPEGARRQ